jgi:hypothetical protein
MQKSAFSRPLERERDHSHYTNDDQKIDDEKEMLSKRIFLVDKHDTDRYFVRYIFAAGRFFFDHLFANHSKL